MKRGKGLLGKALGVVLLVMLTMCIVSSRASAYSIDVQNPYSQKIFVSIVDFEDQAGTWRVEGWWTVEPLSTKRINRPSSTQKSSVYLYVMSSEASWGGEGIATSVVYTVIGNSFRYYCEGQQCPAGPRRRQVHFKKYQLEDGFLYWTPE
jgi:uncharacterized membrane protein